MKKVVWTYGLISGGIAAVLMFITGLSLRNQSNFANSELFGYAGIVLSMMFVYFGLRAYRDQQPGSPLTFAKALQVSGLIALISCVCYVAAWMVVYHTMMPDFMEKFTQYTLDKMKQNGATEAQLQQTTADMAYYKELYKNPLIAAAITFIEPLPVGLLVSLVSSWILKRR
jgi:amino acid transporter